MNKSYRKKITNDIGIVFNVTLTKEKNAKYITFQGNQHGRKKSITKVW